MEISSATKGAVLSGLILACSCDLNSDYEDNDLPATNAADYQPTVQTPIVDDHLRALALKICDVNGDGKPEPSRQSSHGDLIVCADFNDDGMIDIVSATGSGKNWCVSLPEGYTLDTYSNKDCALALDWAINK